MSRLELVTEDAVSRSKAKYSDDVMALERLLTCRVRRLLWPQRLKPPVLKVCNIAQQVPDANLQGSNAVTRAEQPTPISTERQGSVMTSTSSFSRTVWLPRVVDEKNVSAKLADGVLTLTIPKAEDKVTSSTKVAIE